MAATHMITVELNGPPRTVTHKGPYATYELAKAAAIAERDAICAADPANRRAENTTDEMVYTAVEQSMKTTNRAGIEIRTTSERQCATFTIAPIVAPL